MLEKLHHKWAVKYDEKAVAAEKNGNLEKAKQLHDKAVVEHKKAKDGAEDKYEGVRPTSSTSVTSDVAATDATVPAKKPNILTRIISKLDSPFKVAAAVIAGGAAALFTGYGLYLAATSTLLASIVATSWFPPVAAALGVFLVMTLIYSRIHKAKEKDLTFKADENQAKLQQENAELQSRIQATSTMQAGLKAPGVPGTVVKENKGPGANPEISLLDTENPKLKEQPLVPETSVEVTDTKKTTVAEKELVG